MQKMDCCQLILQDGGMRKMMNWIKSELNFTFDIREALLEGVALVVFMIATYFLIVALAG